MTQIRVKSSSSKISPEILRWLRIPISASFTSVDDASLAELFSPLSSSMVRAFSSSSFWSMFLELRSTDERGLELFWNWRGNVKIMVGMLSLKLYITNVKWIKRPREAEAELAFVNWYALVIFMYCPSQLIDATSALVISFCFTLGYFERYYLSLEGWN